MRTFRLTTGGGPRPALPRFVLFALLALLGVAATVSAQSFLGTIRGTVVDPQGAAVAKGAQPREDGGVGGPREGHVGDGRLEPDAAGGQGIEHRGRRPGVAVTADAVCPERVDGHEEDVRALGGSGCRTRPTAAGQECQEEDASGRQQAFFHRRAPTHRSVSEKVNPSQAAQRKEGG